MSRLASLLACLAALMGASGVALAALAAHADGGDFGKLAAHFLILHAAALIGISAHGARALDDARAVLWLGFALALGAILFSADLASLAFLHGRLFPMAAPTGGSIMILSWLALAAVFFARSRSGL